MDECTLEEEDEKKEGLAGERAEEEQEEQEEFIVPDIPGAATAGPSGLDGRAPRVLFPAVTVDDSQNIDKKSKKNK